MRPTDVLKLYYLKHGKLVIDRRFAIEVFQHDKKLGMRLTQEAAKSYKKWKERAQEHAQTGDT
jgi:hypothetical protein|tara:strand:+ start:923 stop:1111 length:189 start_codon:yes stop_codon:yes gene_type:complete